MVDSKFMKDTNRIVFKLEDNSKIIITREYIGENYMYFVNTTQNIDYILSDFAKECGYLINLLSLNIDDNTGIIQTFISENTLLKEEYHIFNGNELRKVKVMYKPFIEEEVYTRSVNLRVQTIKEMTGDIEMIKDMIDNNMLSINNEFLVDNNIFIEPRINLVKKK